MNLNQRNKRRTVVVQPSPVGENERRVLEAERRTAIRRADDAEAEVLKAYERLHGLGAAYDDLEQQSHVKIERLQQRAIVYLLVGGAVGVAFGAVLCGLAW